MSIVLVVDDNQLHRVALRTALQELGLDVQCASDGEEAIKLAKQQTPGWVLMDLNMPNMDGWECVRTMRSHLELSTIPIVAMTAGFLDGDEQRALVAGCSFCVAKPVDIPGLLQCICDCTSKEVAASKSA